MTNSNEIIENIASLNITIRDILSKSDRDDYYLTEQINSLVQASYSQASFLIISTFGREHNFFQQFLSIESTKILDKGSAFTRISFERLSGLLTTIENLSKMGLLRQFRFQILARSVNEFVSEGEKSLNAGQKDVAGILLAASLEIGIGDLFEKFEFDLVGNMSDRINTLRKNEKITDIQKSRLETAARIRNKALHARWDEFGELEVRELMRVVREIILEKLER